MNSFGSPARPRGRPNVSSNGSEPKVAAERVGAERVAPPVLERGRTLPATTSSVIAGAAWSPALTGPISALPAARGFSTNVSVRDCDMRPLTIDTCVDWNGPPRTSRFVSRGSGTSSGAPRPRA